MTDVPHVRPSAGRPRPWPWLLAGLVLAAVSLPGGLAAAHVVRVAPTVGYARPAASSVTFSLAMNDAPAFAPKVLNSTVTGTTSVTVDLTNSGNLTHTFTVENLSQAGVLLNRSWTPEQLNANFVTNPPLDNVSVAGHGTGVASFSVPVVKAPVSLEFVSTEPYQFQAGMFGFLNLTPTGPTYDVTDNTTDALRFVPDILSTPKGAAVTGPVKIDIVVTNLGSFAHTFTVSSQVNVTLTTLAPLKTHAPLTNLTVPSGGSNHTTFTVPAPGIYEYVCTVDSHFQNGMFGLLYVGVPVPPPPPTPTTAIFAIPILAGSAVLLGVGVALAYASAYVGRIPRSQGPKGPHS